MVQDGTYRLVALYDSWSYDRWEDIHDPDLMPRLRDLGPDLADLRLAATFPSVPSQDRIGAALAETDVCLSRTEGCHERRAFAVLDQAGWLALVGERCERFLELAFFENGSPSPIVEQSRDGWSGMTHGLMLQLSSGKPTWALECLV